MYVSWLGAEHHAAASAWFDRAEHLFLARVFIGRGTGDPQHEPGVLRRVGVGDGQFEPVIALFPRTHIEWGSPV